MKEFHGTNFTAKVADNGLLTVWRKDPTVVREQRFENGELVEATWTEASAGGSLGNLAAAMDAMPVLAATYADDNAEDDDNWWHADLDAGFQRWCGMKEHAFIVAGLAEDGFTDDDIKEIARICEAHPWSYCPRQG